MESIYKAFIEYNDNDVHRFEDELPEKWTSLIKPVFRDFLLDSILESK